MNMLNEVRLIDLPKIVDDRGNLSFFENSKQIPFDVQRIYFIYDVPGGAVRGGHAYRELQEFVVAISGSFDVVVDDGLQQKKISLNRSYHGLYLPAGLWRQLENFSTNSLCLVAASTPYQEGDYIRNYDEFKKWRASDGF